MPYFSRFDICRAYWHFAAAYHRGGGSGEYQIFTRLARLGYVPRGHDLNWPQRGIDGDENCRLILAKVVRRWGAKHRKPAFSPTR